MFRVSALKERLRGTFTVELDNIERMLIQIELTVIAGDHESYKISAVTKPIELRFRSIQSLNAASSNRGKIK